MVVIVVVILEVVIVVLFVVVIVVVIVALGDRLRGKPAFNFITKDLVVKFPYLVMFETSSPGPVFGSLSHSGLKD